MTATHPTDRELHSFLLGKLPDAEHSQVESHLLDCPECGRRAMSAPADDTLTELLAAARTRLDSERASAPTPTLDGSATPPAFAPTLAWDGSTDATSDAGAPPALATHPKYRVVRRLGTGGMGTVWLAEHQVMHRPVAVKVIRPDLLARPGATERFLREVRAAARLHHPNIVTAFDAEPVGDSCLLVMEYVPGQTLGERLEAGPLPAAEACRAVRDAARGLAHAHAAGLVHRDVKPHNLIRAADGTTKVLDFGLAGVGAGEVPAASGDGLTGAGMVVGTPDYIAPEQIADPHGADARADIYGLGCTLYHLLAGRPPLPDGSVAEKLAAQPTHEPDPIPGLAADVAAVLARMLAKRAEDRYQTANEVADALERIINDVRPAPAHKWSCTGKPRPVVSWLLAAVIVVAGAVVFKIYRDNQVITVQTDDPDIEVVMKRKGEVLRVIDKKTGHEWVIDTRTNEIALADAPGGLVLSLPEKEEIVLKRNGKEVFTVARRPQPSEPEDRAAKIEAATRAAEAWQKLYDAGEYGRAWDEAGPIVRRAITRDDWIRMGEAAAQRTGKLLARSFVRHQYATAFVRLPEGEYVSIEYRTDYERVKGLDELILVALEPDRRWRVATYMFQNTGRGGPGATPAPAPRLRQTITDRFPQAIAYTPDGKLLLVAGRDSFAAYDPATGKAVFTDTFGFAGPVSPVAVSADGRTAAVAPGDIFLYDLAAHKRMVTIPRPEVDDRPVAVSALALSPDGQTLAYVAGREVVYYDRATGQTEHTRPDDDKVRVFGLRYSPDGQYLAVAARVAADQSTPISPTRISLLDAKTRALVGRYETTSLSGATLQFSRDGRQLFVDGGAPFVAGFDLAGADLTRRTFLVLEVPSAKEVERDPRPADSLDAPVPSPDGHLLALTTADGKVQVWDRGQKRVTFAWAPHPDAQPEFPKGPKAPQHTSVAFAPDGRTLATARGDQIRLWDLTAGSPARSDQDLLQGTWRPVFANRQGLKLDLAREDVAKLMNISLTFSGDRVRLERIDRSGKEPVALPGMDGVFHLDPARTPKQISVHAADPAEGFFGIYKLEGDTLTLLYYTRKAKDVRYPRDFTEQGEPGTDLWVFRRQPPVQADKDRILGTWRGVAAEVGGQAMPQQLLDQLRPTLTFSADRVNGKPQGTIPKPFLDMAVANGLLPKDAATIVENGTEGVYHLDPTKSPKQIDFTILGTVKKTGLGIYQLDGDTLKLCLSIDPAKVDQRPTEFATKAGEMRVLLTLRRLTPEEVILEDVERRIDAAKGDGKNLPFALLERNGAAALRFGQWLVVFEGVPCDSRGKVLFGVGAFFLPETGGRGNFTDPGLKRPAPAVRQQSTGRGNVIGLERYEFQLEAKGARLAFADKTYDATDRVQTIVVARDGTTRLEPPPKK